MSTLKDKAKKFAHEHTNVNAGYILNTYLGYIAGYKEAHKWVSVSTDLPDDDRTVLAYNKEDKMIWVSRMENGEIVPYEDDFFGIYHATHWRETELPE